MVLDKITFIRSSSLARGTDIVDIVKLAKTEIFGCDLLWTLNIDYVSLKFKASLGGSTFMFQRAAAPLAVFPYLINSSPDIFWGEHTLKDGGTFLDAQKKARVWKRLTRTQ